MATTTDETMETTVGYSRNPIVWIAAVGIILLAGLRLVADVQAGDGPVVTVVIVLVVMGVAVLLVTLKRSGEASLAAVSAMKPRSLVKSVVPSTPAMRVNKLYAKSRGLKAKGGMTAQVATFDPESVIVWTGGRKPVIHVAVPSSLVQGMMVRKLTEGVRTYNTVLFLVDGGEHGVMLALKGKDEELRPAVFQITQAIGLDPQAVTFL